MQEIQREPDVANEDLANKDEDLNELRELADGLKDQATCGLFLCSIRISIIYVLFGVFWLSSLFVWSFSLAR